MKHKRKHSRRSQKARQYLNGDAGFLHLNGGYGEYRESEADEIRPLDFEHMDDKKRRQTRRDDEQIYVSLHDDDTYDDWSDDWADEWDDD